MNLKLWGGRFKQSTDNLIESFSASVHYDNKLAPYDILVSLSHARMLQRQNIISQKEHEAIESGLKAIQEDINSGAFEWKQELEDVHMNIEAALINKIGESGKKLHTARSRNDQIATDMRLYLRDIIDQSSALLQGLRSAIIDKAEQEVDSPVPGHTHLQIAQPIVMGHHLLAWNSMLQRDNQRLMDCRKRVNISPLGAGALAGSPYDIDPQFVAKDLGFDAVFNNSCDAVSDRDFLVEFLATAALCMVHLSRICEELILWHSEYFNFIELPDSLCTGSSMMPQKKNPDIPELIRGKSGRVVGHLNALLMVLKSQPLTYNRDNQEDKEAVFDGAETLMNSLLTLTPLIEQMTFKRDVMYQALNRGYATATDLADYLVRIGIPFRSAHEYTGKIVTHAISLSKPLADLELKDLQSICPQIQKDVYQAISIEQSLAARKHHGGTAPATVRIALKQARQDLQKESVRSS